MTIDVGGVRIALIPIVLLAVALVILGILIRYRFSLANIPIWMRPYLIVAVVLLLVANIIVLLFGSAVGLHK